MSLFALALITASLLVGALLRKMRPSAPPLRRRHLYFDGPLPDPFAPPHGVMSTDPTDHRLDRE
jgi:hypothetical protein